MQESLNPGDRALLRGQGTPYVCRAARANHQLSLLGGTCCSARRFCEENCAAQELKVWNLPDPHLSSLPSPLPPDRMAPFSAPLLPKGLGPEHTWELGGGRVRHSPDVDCRPLRVSEGHKGLRVGRPSTITSLSPHGVQPPSLSPKDLSFGRRSQRQGDQLLWEVLLPGCSVICSSHLQAR